MNEVARIRLDQLLVERHGYESRSRARDAVLRGCVSLEGRVLTKPGQLLPRDSEIAIEDAAGRLVSRAALKLIHALEKCKVPVAGKSALDLGASTGGFTQVLLERGAAKVFAIDVGHGQLHPRLRADKRVTTFENLNVRDLTPSHLDGEAPEIVVSDLSFISLLLALPPTLELSAPGAVGIFLVKPQFEAGKEHVGRGGIVRDETVIKVTVDRVRTWLDGQSGWTVADLFPSPILGSDGNREFLMIGHKEP